MSRPGNAAQVGRHCSLFDLSGVPGGIHFLYGRGEHNVCLAFLTELQIALEISWIGIEILADPELAQVLLYDRNRSWAAQIENLLSASERPLIAVGAGHLLGERGLPALLESRGYTVSRLE